MRKDRKDESENSHHARNGISTILLRSKALSRLRQVPARNQDIPQSAPSAFRLPPPSGGNKTIDTPEPASYPLLKQILPQHIGFRLPFPGKATSCEPFRSKDLSLPPLPESRKVSKFRFLNLLTLYHSITSFPRKKDLARLLLQTTSENHCRYGLTSSGVLMQTSRNM